MPEQIAFHVDSSVCTSCKSCQIACADTNNLPAGIAWRRVLQYGGGKWVDEDGLSVPANVFTYSVSVSCMHCEKPACIEACSNDAIRKGADGVVCIYPDLCAGCRQCEDACPYGAPQFNAELGVMTKCELCPDRQAYGLDPACVSACPMRAIHVGPLEKMRQLYGKVNAVAPLPEAETGPALVITPHRHTEPAGKGSGKILDLLAPA